MGIIAWDESGPILSSDGSQVSDEDLTTIAGLTPTTNNIIQSVSSAWASRTPAQVKATLSLVKGDVGLGNVDNTADTAKPVSTAQQTALDLKANIASPTFTGTVGGITKSMVGLGSVDNTADTAKPVSTAQQTALDLKANIASPTFTGTVSGITKSMVGLGNVDNTADTAKPVSTAQQTALDLKANIASPTFTGTVGGVTKSMVGLANVDNTADASKPVSTAQQTALDLKQDLDSDLTAIAALSPSNDDVIQRKAGAWTNRTIAQLSTDLVAKRDVHYSLGSGRYYYAICPGGSSASTTANQTLRLAPWIVERDVTIVRIGAEVSTVGEAGSVIRLGIYADAGGLYPGALVLDAGTIAGDSATIQEITISQALTRGVYWVGGVAQSAPSTQPTVRMASGWTPPVPMQTGTTIPVLSASVVAYTQASVSGGLPSNFTSTVTTSGNAMRIFFKTA